MPDPELARYAEGDGSYDCSGAEIGELIAVVTYAFGPAVVAIYESCIRFPRFGRLVLEFLAVWVVALNALLDLGVDGCLDFG